MDFNVLSADRNHLHRGGDNGFSDFFVCRRELQDISNFAQPPPPLTASTKLAKMEINQNSVDTSSVLSSHLHIYHVGEKVHKCSFPEDEGDTKKIDNQTDHDLKSKCLDEVGKFDDPEQDEAPDELTASTYASEIYDYLGKVESKYVVSTDYFLRQRHITENMRAILVDWLIGVHHKFRLHTETLFLTVNYLDRYLEVKDTDPKALQLLGITCLLLASKFEEIIPPDLKDLIIIMNRTYTKSDIINFEYSLLSVLEFNLSVPTVHVFLMRFLEVAKADRQTRFLASYYSHQYLLVFNLIKFRPSSIAIACVYLALRATHQLHWSTTLEKCCGYTEDQVIRSARVIHHILLSTHSLELKCVNKKFLKGNLGSVPLPSVF